MTIQGKKLANLSNGSGSHKLGYLVRLNVGECLVPMVDTEEKVALLDLDQEAFPNHSDASAFKAATKDGGVGRFEADNGDSVIYMVRNLGRKRRLVRERQNANADRLEYDADVGEWELLGSGTKTDPYEFRTRHLQQANPKLDAIFKEKDTVVRNLFSAYQVNWRSEQIRPAIIRWIRGISGINADRALYFVPARYAHELENIKEFAQFANDFKAPGSVGVKVRTIPVWDEEEMVEMVKEDFISYSSEEVDKLVSEIDKLVADGKEIYSSRYTTLLDKMEAIASTADEYAELLDLGTRVLDKKLDVVQASMDKLKGLVKTPKRNSNGNGTSNQVKPPTPPPAPAPKPAEKRNGKPIFDF